MKYLMAVLCAVLMTAVGCQSTSSSSSLANNAVRSYNGTASVGDFLTIILDSNAHTIAYTNHSNGDAGTVPYTVNADGTYALSDPTGNLLAAYEVPNYALLIQAAKTGPTHNAPALITAVESGPISVSTWANHKFNYMQFRTASGGFESGSVAMDGQGNVSGSSYWPYGAQNQSGSPFNIGSFPGNNFQSDPSGTFMKLPDGQGGFDYVFGTANGIFAVDTQNGAVLGLQQASSKGFDPAFAGTYKAILYRKTGASTGQGNVETGTPSLGNATIILTTAGGVTIQDALGNSLGQGTLTPVADTAYLYGSAGQLQDPCFGLFTLRLTTANLQQDIFVSFMGQAMLFSSYQTSLPMNGANPYDYFYGVGLK